MNRSRWAYPSLKGFLTDRAAPFLLDLGKAPLFTSVRRSEPLAGPEHQVGASRLSGRSGGPRHRAVHVHSRRREYADSPPRDHPSSRRRCPRHRYAAHATSCSPGMRSCPFVKSICRTPDVPAAALHRCTLLDAYRARARALRQGRLNRDPWARTNACRTLRGLLRWPDRLLRLLRTAILLCRKPDDTPRPDRQKLASGQAPSQSMGSRARAAPASSRISRWS